MKNSTVNQKKDWDLRTNGSNDEKQVDHCMQIKSSMNNAINLKGKILRAKDLNRIQSNMS